ncbi:hypothetical protein WJ78_18140 [Burkholderia ubonensis]|nr:hypothetical protein WJ78_18140 [Burkholderia ubonensis]KVO82441.1 hypothetical protein WJ81_24405 [Burkholderia ubonensis]KVU18250.1 hypothetical protein WK64_07615 [Burkholderia ubonensis]KVZ70685.1 hypothetical protein WL20_33090 [Burkholderia ubonensis]KVZ70849.1 hypothetical protein WL21_08965 [Burkholderia ubonensis]
MPMRTGSERDRLEHDVAMRKRDLYEAEAALQRSMNSVDRPPNESLVVRLERARADLDAAKLALQKYDERSNPPR